MSDFQPVDPRDYYANQGGQVSQPAPSDNYAGQSSSGGGFGAVDPRDYYAAQQAKPEPAQLSYWQRPDNIVAAYNAIQAAPDDYNWQALGVNVEAVTSAFDYLKQANGTGDWSAWKPLDTTDPFAQALAALGEPATEIQWDSVWKPAVTDTAIAPTTPALPTGADLAQLQGWQQAAAFAMSNGALSGVTMALPWMAMGAGAGFMAGGPVGAILGAGGALLAGGLLGFLGDPEQQEQRKQELLAAGYSQGFVDTLQATFNGAMGVLNKPAEWMEQGLGTGIQLTEAAIDPNRTVAELMADLPEVWEASRLTYEAAATTNLGGAIAELPAGIEWLIDMARTGTSDVQFAGDGEVMTLGPEQVQRLDVFGMGILNAARNEVMAGADPDKVVEKWQAMTGFSGQFADMMYQSLADPLNVMPLAERGVIGKIGDLTGDGLLSKAAKVARDEGAIGTFRKYGELLRTDSAAPDPWKMTRFQQWVSDVDPVTGAIKELSSPATRAKRGLLTFAENPLNPMSWWQGLKELTPKSKGDLFNGMMQDNLGEFFYTHAGDVDAQERALNAITDLPVQEVKAASAEVGSVEWYTAQQALKSGADKTRAMFDAYRKAEPIRQQLARIAEATGIPMEELVKRVGGAGKDGVALSKELAGALPEGHLLLSDPALTPASLSKMGKFIKSNPFVASPEQFTSRLYMHLANSMEAWSIKAFGIKPEAKLFRANAALKSVQSLILLDASLGYLATNIATDTSTKITDGVLGFASKEKLKAYADDFLGWSPSAARDGIAGISGDEMRSPTKAYASVEEAMQKGGSMAAMEYANAEAMRQAFEATKAGDTVDKIAGKVPRPGFGMRAASAGYEAKSRLATHYTATMGAWSRLWQEGRSIPKMPDNLRRNLDAIAPGLSKLVMAAVKDSKNKAGLSRLMTGVERMATGKAVQAYVPELSGSLGIPEAEVQATLSQLGVIEKLDAMLGQGVSIKDAFGAIDRDMRAINQANLAGRMKARGEQAAATYKAEGLPGVVNIVNDLAWMRDEFHMQHFRDRETDASNGWMGYSAEAVDQGWRQLQDTERATWQGLLKQMGLTKQGDANNLSPDALRFLAAEKAISDAWRTYYTDLRKLYKGGFEATRGMVEGSEGYQAVYRDIQQAAHELYKKAAARELDLTKAKGDAFIKAWREQHGDDQLPAIAFWMKGIYDANQRRSGLMIDFRSRLMGGDATDPRVKALPNDSKNKLWTQFLEKAYLPAIGEMTMAQMEGVNAFADAANGMPMRGDYSEAMQFFGLDKTQPAPNVPPPDEVDIVQQRATDIAAVDKQVEQTQQPITPTTERRQSTNGLLRQTIAEQAATIKGLEGRLDKLSHDDVAMLPLGVVNRAEIDAAPWKVAIDLNGLGWTNSFDHKTGGDIMIRAFAETSREQGVKMYRMRNGGDEFAITANTREEAEAAATKLLTAYRAKVIPLKAPGEPAKSFTGFDFTYAIGQDLDAADAAATAIKNKWYADNPNFKKGTQPPQITDAGGREAYDLTVPEERREYMRDGMKIPERHLDAAMAVYDYVAETWATRFGRTVEEYWQAIGKRGTPEDVVGDVSNQKVEAKVEFSDAATTDDFDAATEQWRTLNVYVFGPLSDLGEVDGVRAIVASVDGAPVAYAITEDTGFVSLWHVEVKPEYRGMGIAEQLVKETGATFAHEVVSDNAAKLFRKLGIDFEDAREYQPSMQVGEPRGAWDRVKRMMYAFEKADADTWVHEGAHLYFDNLPASEQERILRVFDGDPEKFADGYVTWMSAASKTSVPDRIQRAFASFRDFLRGVLDRVLGKGKIPGKKVSKEQVAEFERMFKLDAWDMPDATPEVIAKALADGYYVRPDILAAHPEITAEQAAKLADGDPVNIAAVDAVPDGPERVLLVRQIAAEYGIKGDSRITATLRKAEYGGDPAATLHNADPDQVRAVFEKRREVKAAQAAAKAAKPDQPTTEPTAKPRKLALDNILSMSRNEVREVVEQAKSDLLHDTSERPIIEKATEFREFTTYYRDLFNSQDPATMTAENFYRLWGAVQAADGGMGRIATRENYPGVIDAFSKYGKKWLIDNQRGKATPMGAYVASGKATDGILFDDLFELHRAFVEQALAEGRTIPENILAGYPDLAVASKPSPAPQVPDVVKAVEAEQAANVAALREAEGVAPAPAPKAKRPRGTFDPNNPNILYQHPDAPRGVSVQRFLTPQAIGGRTIIGATYIDGAFVAYVPNRLDTTKRFDTDAGVSRVLGVDPDGDWVIYNEATGETKTLPAKPDETFPTVGPMVPDGLGAQGAAPLDEAQLFGDGYSMWGKPILDGLQAQMQKGLPATKEGLNLSRLKPEDMKALRQYVEQVAGAMSKTKMSAVRIGDQRTEFSLLNYNKRYGIDKYLDLAFPYQFWFSRSMVNWALRFADRPGLLAFFSRLAQFTDDDLDEQYGQIPSRMKGKLKIPMPFLNSIAPWAGGNIYIDPLGKLFPFRDFLRPWERYGQDQTRVRRVTEQYLQKMADSGEIDPDEARLAMAYIEDPSNPEYAGGRAAYQQAQRMAQQQEGGDAVDFLSLISAPSLAFSLITRGPSKTGPFPLSRTMQALSAVTGWDALATLDPEAKLRQGAGLSEFGEWGNYYIDRMLANMAGDGSATADEVTQAMIDRSGPVYEEAMNRTRKELALREPGMLPLLAARNALTGDGNILDILGAALVGWLPGGLLPEGELELRGLADEYRAAWDSRNSGQNPQAVNEFFEAHPEYSARLALWDEPEERLRQFMISQVWDAYSNLNDLDRKSASRMLGRDFQTMFLNSETRDTDGLSTKQLVQWSQALGGLAPQAAPEAQPLQLGGDITAAYQAEKDKLFPGIDDLLARYYDASDEQQAQLRVLMPQIDKYWEWQAQYATMNPAVIPYMASGDLAEADPDTQFIVFQYRSEKARLFPGIGTALDQYYAYPKGSAERKALYRQRPELQAYWDWERDFLARFPDVTQYVKSEASALKAMFGEDYTGKYGTPVNPSSFTPEAQTALTSYFRYGDSLSYGAQKYLYYQWEKSGMPFSSFTAWVESLGVFY